MDESFHYPPELLNLCVDTIPLLCRSKQDVLLFFRSAGVPEGDMHDLRSRLAADRSSISKFEITRTLLQRINERGDTYLRQRREVIKRVSEFEDYSACWESDVLKAKGAVSEVRRIVNVKDSFTRMAQEREREREQRVAQAQKERNEAKVRRDRIAAAKAQLYALFPLENDPSKRGLALEKVLNDLFKAYDILIAENFKRRAPEVAGVIEQIDGVVQIDRWLVLVEMKWLREPAGVEHTAQHLVRVYSRPDTRGFMMSTSGFTGPAIEQHRQALGKKVLALCHLEEIVGVLERETDLVKMMREKLLAAELDLNPNVKV